MSHQLPSAILLAAFVVVSATNLCVGQDSAHDETGPAFHRGATRAGMSLGAGPGSPILGSTSHHDLALARIDFGWTCTEQVLTNSFVAGHVELVAEAFGGAQFSPQAAYLTGVGPFLRYNFTRGQRFIPFIELGAGILLTDIGEPDLSGTFQFHEQGGLGAHFFLSRRSALSFNYRFMHISNADISSPNLGVNNHSFSLGFARFF